MSKGSACVYLYQGSDVVIESVPVSVTAGVTTHSLSTSGFNQTDGIVH